MGRCPQHAVISASSFSKPAGADGCSDAVTKPEYTLGGSWASHIPFKRNIDLFFFLVQNRRLFLVQNNVTLFVQGGSDKGCWMVLPDDESVLLCKASLAHGACSNCCSMSTCPPKEPGNTVFTGAVSPNGC